MANWKLVICKLVFLIIRRSTEAKWNSHLEPMYTHDIIDS